MIAINSEPSLSKSSLSNKILVVNKVCWYQGFFSLKKLKPLRACLIMFQKFKDIIQSEMDADGPAGE